MKLRVIKHWWQFWLPEYLYVDIQTVEWNRLYKNIADEVTKRYFSPVMTIDDSTTVANYEGMSPAPKGSVDQMLNEPSSIEANEAEPWYNSEPSDSDSVVTVEPDLVAKSRGNNTMRERMNGE